MSFDPDVFDYVILGGGSAGCVLAGRLSEDPSLRVLLLETGDRAERHPESLRADGYKDAFVNDDLLHHRFSVPQRHCGRRPLFLGSGRGMGGSGSINAMVYLRGSEADFRAWDVPGWGWSDVVPAYEQLERVLDVRSREPTEFTEACIAGAEEVGFHRERDLDRGELLGALGYERMNYRGEQRRSAYVAFVQPHLDRINLVVRTGAHAHRLVLDDRRRVVAVEYEEGGTRRTAQVRREAVLCAGALESPKLLMLSGVGPRDVLRAHGIEPAFDLPGVGENLHDHPNVQLFYFGKRAVDCNYPQLYGFHRALPESDLPADQADTCYVFYPARSSFREATMRMVPALTVPPALYRRTRLPRLVKAGVGMAFRPGFVKRAVERVYGVVVILGKPKSRGTVRLASADPREQAAIDPAYFADPEDMRAMIAGVRLARRIAAAEGLRPWGGPEVLPGAFVRSDAALAAFVRRMAMTTYHYAGTCRMGQVPGSVVDPQLRVRGVENLRVADASIIPEVPVSALNAPSMMIGWRAADLLRAAAAG
ncbi:Choline dehydrogenase [Nannocystis exedens]|uniref:Choline dehydrogenase n=1 Tax=Nannocystis exedens TaxID=54 RepID=A0A1I2EG20_9BACT|nr:GMC family oxidoreductase N-terminal domain-containing protein [Nannocystis exedens]PCC74743.1 glucose-methanol-choline oxidoreductase [Nannocystis exedens]SFE91633.1 Choline dehydrogenase [Nannocystis exedens]